MMCPSVKFLCSCSLEGKNSDEIHRAVLSNKSVIKQNESTLPRKDESVLSGNQKQSHNVGRAGFSEWWNVPSYVLHCCFDKLTGNFSLYNFFLVHRYLPTITEVKPTGAGVQKTKCSFITNLA